MNSLDGNASYQVDGDVILCTLYIHDSADQKWHPERVRVGTVKLTRGSLTITSRNFDARFGNSDGAFHFDFAHPTVNDAMFFEANVTLVDGTVLTTRVPVTRYEDENDPPLAQQPQVTSNQYGLIKT